MTKTHTPDNIDLNNPEFQHAWDLIQHTHRSVFLTGKAGTGKSTFLKYICSQTTKEFVVLAPTGIAAVNVGGQTLHSFFKIPLKPLLPDDPDYSPRNIRKTLRYSSDKIKLIKKLDMIVIDEISMVRADVIDFIDNVLRIYSGNMREPFGGKQMLFVGDVFQLEPVVTADARTILLHCYRQFFFFCARAFSQMKLVPIELRKIYRQTDDSFISLLDRVRVNHASAADIAMLNSRYNPNYRDNDGFTITLATRRDTVDAINSEHMNALTTPEFTFHGKVDGTFPDNDLPTSNELTLKEGAQVIFIRNDKDSRWYNGTIGMVSSLDNDKIEVELEDGNTYNLEKEVWEKIQYTYDAREKKVIENLLGTFEQYPVKPAWALTVHKSQGLTFNNIVIDFAGGAFTSGQTYVALSRCTSLEGITLLRPLSARDIIVSMGVVEFSKQFNNQSLIDEALKQEESNRLFRKAVHAFDHNEFRTCVETFAQASLVNNVIHTPAAQRLIAKKLSRISAFDKKIADLEAVIDSQNRLLHDLAMEYTEMGNQSLGYGSLAGESAVAYGSGNGKRLDDVSLHSAMANYNKALRICPDCIEAMIGKGRLLTTIDQTDEAIATFTKAIAVNKRSFDAHMGIAEAHYAGKDTPAAIKAYKRAAKAATKRPEPHEALARIYDKLGLDDLAEEEADIAKRLRKPAKTSRSRKPKA